MFELSVAFKYLIPRWRQLSVSIISMISVLVIALVVWLIVVFFSVVNGLEKTWVDKLIALTAPVRVTPTDAYYNSYYYQSDSISSGSEYTHKTLREKLKAPQTDPYNPKVDEEIPAEWPRPELNPDGSEKDLVKLAYQAIGSMKDVPGLKASDYEMTVSNMRLRLIRDGELAPTGHVESSKNQAFLSQTAYLGSFDSDNPLLMKAVLPYTNQDISNLYSMIGVASDDIKEESPETVKRLEKDVVVKRLQTFFKFVTVKELKTPSYGWILPKALYPETARFRSIAIANDGRIQKLIIPAVKKEWLEIQNQLEKEGYKTHVVNLDFAKGQVTAVFENNTTQNITKGIPLILVQSLAFPATPDIASIEKATQPKDVLFDVELVVQSIPLKGKIPFGNLSIASAKIKDPIDSSEPLKPFWVYKQKKPDGTLQMILPSDPYSGDAVLLPKGFRDAGTFVGDRGFLSYFTPTASSVQEQRIPIFVAGYYDPGIIPIGGKYVLVNSDITSLIRATHNQEDKVLSNGINIRFDNIAQADHVKAELLQAFKKLGIDQYWHVETYREYEFTKDLMQQLRSEANLFTLISIVIIIVACSNIISMLIILVNDKKLEIGILRSMGASSASIAGIFGLCGVIMGVLGSLIGTAVAIITLKNLNALVGMISWCQGYEMFNPMFYGETLPNEISFEALSFVLIATALISLLAGIVPATKACLLRPSAILRSE